MAESNLTKKVKTEDGAKQYFKNFLSDDKNKELIFMLRTILAEINAGAARSSVYFLRITAANANSYQSFSKATVDAEVHYKGPRVQAVPLGLFFLRGFAVLKRFLDKIQPKMSDDLVERQALRNLLQFLSDQEHSVLSEESEAYKTEAGATLAVRLAQHLLIPLVPHETFKINHYPGLQDVRCCPVDHAMKGTKGDTSFGCPRGWHGCADILLLGDEIPLTVLETGADPGHIDAVSVRSDSSVEVKEAETFTTESISKLTAQTIVHSFVQHRKNPASQNTLVPGIGISPKKIIVNLYDCVDDILLTTGTVDLHVGSLAGSTLNARAVIILWLVLNHKLFGNKTPDKFKGFKAAFHDIVGPVQLQAYKNDCEQPLKTKPDKKDLLNILEKEYAYFSDDVSEYIDEGDPATQSFSCI